VQGHRRQEYTSWLSTVRQYIRAEGSDPYIRVGTVTVYVGGHEFDDDDIAWPQGSDIPLQSEYPAMIEIRDIGGQLIHSQRLGVVTAKSQPQPVPINGRPVSRA
jgi:hypothetical protein